MLFLFRPIGQCHTLSTPKCVICRDNENRRRRDKNFFLLPFLSLTFLLLLLLFRSEALFFVPLRLCHTIPLQLSGMLVAMHIFTLQNVRGTCAQRGQKIGPFLWPDVIPAPLPSSIPYFCPPLSSLFRLFFCQA